MKATTLPQPSRFAFSFEPSEREALVAEIDSIVAALNGCYEELSPKAKACAIRAAHALAKLRNAR